MKWFTHQTVAMAAAVALGMTPAAVGGALAGAVLPDVIDQRVARMSRNPQRRFNQIHRGASHWVGWYAVLLAGALAAPLPPASAALAAGVGFGALAHVILDMLTPSGVPLTPFSRKNKLSLRLCSTGSLGEYVFLAASLGALYLLAGERAEQVARAAAKLLRL